MSLVLTGAHKGGDHTLPHDLNFQKQRYEATHVVVSYFLAEGIAAGLPWVAMRKTNRA